MTTTVNTLTVDKQELLKKIKSTDTDRGISVAVACGLGSVYLRRTFGNIDTDALPAAKNVYETAPEPVDESLAGLYKLSMEMLEAADFTLMADEYALINIMADEQLAHDAKQVGQDEDTNSGNDVGPAPSAESVG